MGAVQGHRLWGLGGRCGRLEYFLPDAAIAPPGEAVVDRFRGAVFAWAINPAAADLQNVHDPAENASIVVTSRSRLVRRQMRLDLRPPLVREPEQMRFHRLAPQSFGQPFESEYG